MNTHESAARHNLNADRIRRRNSCGLDAVKYVAETNAFQFFPELIISDCVQIAMPYFFYDLIIGRNVHDQGGMKLADRAAAITRADNFAKDLLVLRPELTGHGAAIRVMDDKQIEIYRTPLDPAPKWSVSHRDH